MAAGNAVALTPVILVAVEGTQWQDLYGERWRSALDQRDVGVVGGDHLALAAITSDRLLDVVIEVAFEGAADDGEVYTAEGGVMLTYNGEVLHPPRCCSDLEESIADWIALLNNEHSDWVLLAAGHDHDTARLSETFARLSDDDVEVVHEWSVYEGWRRRQKTVRDEPVAVPRDLLEEALTVALKEQTAFAERLERRLREHGHANARTVARTIAGAGGSEHSQ